MSAGSLVRAAAAAPRELMIVIVHIDKCLAGMLLPLGDIGVTDAVIGGPPRTRSLINAFRYFVHRCASIDAARSWPTAIGVDIG